MEAAVLQAKDTLGPQQLANIIYTYYKADNAEAAPLL